jgi:hypothetical protein
MDCDLSPNRAPVPYPQFYAYQLMASPDYLDLNSGGYLAASVAPALSSAGLAITAFFTPKRDSILIVNPTGQTLSESVTARNLGLPSPTASLYRVADGKSIDRTSLALTQSGTDYEVTISIPPYSVLGISIQ